MKEFCFGWQFQFPHSSFEEDPVPFSADCLSVWLGLKAERLRKGQGVGATMGTRYKRVAIREIAP